MKKESALEFGLRVKARRKELKLTQTELADRLGLKNKSSISDIEHGKNDITTTRIKRIAEALECSELYLLGLDSNTFDVENTDAELSADLIANPVIKMLATEFLKLNTEHQAQIIEQIEFLQLKESKEN